MYVISWSPSEGAVCSKTEKRPTRSSSQPNPRSGRHTANISRGCTPASLENEFDLPYTRNTGDWVRVC